MTTATESAAPPAVPASHRLFTGFLVVACIALSVLVVILTRQNAELRERASQAMERGLAGAMKVGERLVPLECFGNDSASTSALAFGDGRFATVLFVVSGTCPACAACGPFFERVAAAHAGDTVRVGAIQTDAKVPGDLKVIGSGVTVVGVKDPASTWLQRFPFVPGTIVVDHRGEVRAVYFGELSSAQQEDLDALLKRAGAGWTAPTPN